MGNEKWILPYIRQYRRFFALAILLGSITILFGAGLMFTSGYLISKSAARPESILLVYVPIVGVRTFGIGRAAISYVERLSGHSLILKILAEMRLKLYKMVEPQAYSLRSRFRTGDMLGLLADDIEHLQDFYLKTLFPSIISLIIYTIIIICTGLFSIPFAILLAMLIGLLVFVGPAFSLLYLKSKNMQLKIERHHLYDKLTDAVLGISDWRFSGHYSSFILDYEKQEQRLFQLEVKKHSFVNRRDVWNQFILGITVVTAIAWADGLMVKGEISASFIAAVGLAMLSLLESFLPLSEVVSEITTYLDSLNRLRSIEWQCQIENENLDNQCVLTHTSETLIKVNQVTFGYSPSNPILKGIDVTIRQGEKIAILGRSGAGKSTLLNLLQGALKPLSGEVQINGRNTYELEDSISKWVSVLNQRAYLFNTTVINNIRLGRPEATDEEIYQVSRMVQLDEFIKQLPNGYETNMQETGQRFSGGERHRIALARILLQDSPIVILDEPTVGLDPMTETKLLATIFNTLKDKTIIWVTHHLAGVENMDRILFLEKGTILMEGSHKHLFATEEKYRQLYQIDRPFGEISREFHSLRADEHRVK